MSRAELEAEFASDQPERILNALIAAFYTEPADWVETRCYACASHSSAVARRGAAIVLGNIGCSSGLKDLSRAVMVLETLREDEDAQVKMQAEDSLNWVLDLSRKRSQLQ